MYQEYEQQKRIEKQGFLSNFKEVMNKKTRSYPQVINKMWITCLFCGYCLFICVYKQNKEKKSKNCLTLKDSFNIIEAMFYEHLIF